MKGKTHNETCIPSEQNDPRRTLFSIQELVEWVRELGHARVVVRRKPTYAFVAADGPPNNSHYENIYLPVKNLTPD